MFNKIFFIVVLTVLGLQKGFSQDSLKVKVDSVQKMVSKAMTADTSKKISKLKAFGTTMKKVAGAEKIEPDERPKIAFIRSLIIPSTGQITNKQYWKVPIIVGAAVGDVFWIRSLNRKYKNYRSYLIEMNDKGLTEITIDGRGPYSLQGVTSATNTFRRYRDLNIIGFTAGWLIFAVEANVAAHLKTFDMSEDISMKITPTVLNGPMNAAFGVKFELNIK
jgi:hypothetical protein